MRTLFILLTSILRSVRALFRSREEQAIVELALRQQLAVYAQNRHRPRLSPLDRALVLDALREALVHRPEARDLVHHSDRGSQYASYDYREALDQAGITCSMSRRGDCWDNAVAESFFGTLKMELLYELPLQTRSATRSAVADYIETFYNLRRRHSSLDYQSPVEFELKNGALGALPPNPRS